MTCNQLRLKSADNLFLYLNRDVDKMNDVQAVRLSEQKQGAFLRHSLLTIYKEYRVSYHVYFHRVSYPFRGSVAHLLATTEDF